MKNLGKNYICITLTKHLFAFMYFKNYLQFFKGKKKLPGR